MSLRTVFLLITVACVWLGWFVHRANQQRGAVQWVTEAGGVVWYDYQWDKYLGVIPDAEPPGPGWLRDLIGIDHLASVVSVSLDSTQISDVTPLTKIPHLCYVDLDNTRVTEDDHMMLRLAKPNCRVDWTPRPFP